MRPQIIFLLTCICLPACLFGQKLELNYYPERNFGADKTVLASVMERFNAKKSKVIAGKPADIAKDIKTSYDELEEEIHYLDSLKRLMYTDTLSRYLQGILNKITSASPELSGKAYTLFTYRTFEPNACSMGEGVFYVNLDIIYKVETEAQIAFILCHELAHDKKEHVTKGIEKTAILLNDKAFKEEQKKISKQEFGALKSMDGLIGKLMSKKNEHTREHETEADSLGLLFFIRVGYDPDQALYAISKLDSMDALPFKQKIGLKNYFDFPAFHYDESWTFVDTTDLDWTGNIVYTIPDSLKTHPDCKDRRAKLESILTGQAKSGIKETGDFHFFAEKSKFEMVEHLVYIRQYSLALYYALQLLDTYPQNQYLKCTVANCMYEISESLKNHTFSTSVDLPNNTFPESYNELLRLLNQTSYSEQEKLTRNFHEKNVKDLSADDAYSNYVSILVSAMNKPDLNKAEKKLEVEAFYTKHNNKYYYDKLKRKFNLTN